MTRTTDIIMSAPMVRACIREVEAPGTGKTMTRRLAWNRKKANADPLEDMGERDANKDEWRRFAPSPWQKVKAGDRLWVRETWKPHSMYAGMKPRDIPQSKVFFAADDAYAPSNTPWVPPIHMPRWASRITLEVTANRMEPLQAIDDADARREGMIKLQDWQWTSNVDDRSMYASSGPGAFYLLWCALHDKKSWDANPEVVAVTFKPYLCNIDRMKESA